MGTSRLCRLNLSGAIYATPPDGPVLVVGAVSLTAALTKTRPDVSNRELLERIEALEKRLTATLGRER